MQVYDSLAEVTGGTPLVRLRSVTRGVARTDNVLAKVEYLNPGGSIKDRIALRMIDAAEREGKLVKGGTIIEPTSGNQRRRPWRVAQVERQLRRAGNRPADQQRDLRPVRAGQRPVIPAPSLRAVPAAEAVPGPGAGEDVRAPRPRGRGDQMVAGDRQHVGDRLLISGRRAAARCPRMPRRQ